MLLEELYGEEDLGKVGKKRLDREEEEGGGVKEQQKQQEEVGVGLLYREGDEPQQKEEGVELLDREEEGGKKDLLERGEGVDEEW